ncbi:phytoene desaturase family protein [Phycisphaerales bacterium AB-hyl4]|uniref:Phytoene desaturase family protein n=1 Tax=Natronomicrosphaera hydrolytica TaxID=3242702 RepID=A0ABV4U104_9BACT
MITTSTNASQLAKSDRDRVIVIGGGLAGLAAACTLAGRGYAVSLFESNAWVGGKACQLHDRGYRFDMGPTIVTMPKMLRRIFDEAGRNMDEELELVRLDPQWRCFFDSGDVLDLREQVQQMQQELKAFGLDEKQTRQYAAFIRYAERLHDISERFFFDKPIGSIGDMVSLGLSFNARTLGDVLSMRMGRSVAATIRKYVPDERVAQMLDHFTQYVGSSPFASPTILCGIASMQVNEGVWYPIGGTRAVPETLARVAVDLGVRIHTGVGVSRIVTQAGRVQSVITEDGQVHACGAVVSNMDAVRTMRELVDGHDHQGNHALGRDALSRYEPACSGVVLYLGLREAYPHLAHHDFVFSRDPDEEFDYIYRRGEPAPDPTCYLAATARTEPASAPPGGEALYVLVHTPYLRPHHDWTKLLPAYRETILDKLERTAGLTDIRERIVTEHALTPQDIHDRYRVLNGAIYGLASHGKWTGAFKPGNRSDRIKGLYLAGGAAHPGPGMPMVLQSGWIAADVLDQDAVVDKQSTMKTKAMA